MVLKTWDFLAPSSGRHELQAEYRAEAWRIWLDGLEQQVQTADGGVFIAGPGGSQLVIQCHGTVLHLFVDGAMVEQAGTDSSRDLLNTPDGSYTIAPTLRSKSKMKTWHFLLPGTGRHELQAENFGETWRMRVDGVEQNYQASQDGQLVVAGPGGSQMILQCRGNVWHLFVDGAMVEEAGNSCLRDLRNTPDGSYTIAPSFSSAGLNLHIVRKFRFNTMGSINEVQIAHSDWAWRGSFEDNKRTFQVLLNGDVVDQRVHNVWDSNYSTQIQAQASSGQKVHLDVSIS